MKLSFIILSSLFLTVGMLLIVNLTVSNLLSTQGIDLQQLQDNLHSMQVQDTNLEQKVLTMSSYTKIASEAATFGYVPDNKAISLNPQQTEPLAYNP